jgi:hypothetical protein
MLYIFVTIINIYLKFQQRLRLKATLLILDSNLQISAINGIGYPDDWLFEYQDLII